MSNTLTVTIDKKEVELVEHETTQRDCRGCYFSVGNRYLNCPDRCCLSTFNNDSIIYKKSA